MPHSLFQTYFRETHERIGWVVENCRRRLITPGFVSDTDADNSSGCTFWLYWNKDWRVAQCAHPSEPSSGWIRHIPRADVFQFQNETKKNERPECAVQSHEPHTGKWQFMGYVGMLNKIHKCQRGSSVNTKHMSQAMESVLYLVQVRWENLFQTMPAKIITPHSHYFDL